MVGGCFFSLSLSLSLCLSLTRSPPLSSPPPPPSTLLLLSASGVESESRVEGDFDGQSACYSLSFQPQSSFGSAAAAWCYYYRYYYDCRRRCWRSNNRGVRRGREKPCPSVPRVLCEPCRRYCHCLIAFPPPPKVWCCDTSSAQTTCVISHRFRVV